MDVPTTYLDYWPVLLALGAAFFVCVAILIVSALVTRRRPNPVKQEPYECGIPPLGPARVQVSVKFYLIALLFLLFDMETMFILAWAVTFQAPAFQTPAMQRFCLIEMGVFIGVLLVGYLYAWRKGALEWS